MVNDKDNGTGTGMDGEAKTMIATCTLLPWAAAHGVEMSNWHGKDMEGTMSGSHNDKNNRTGWHWYWQWGDRWQWQWWGWGPEDEDQWQGRQWGRQPQDDNQVPCISMYPHTHVGNNPIPFCDITYSLYMCYHSCLLALWTWHGSDFNHLSEEMWIS